MISLIHDQGCIFNKLTCGWMTNCYLCLTFWLKQWI